MSDTERIAREAALRIVQGRAGDVADAIRGAVGHLRLRQADVPSHALVRSIVQAMAQQSLGAEGYAAATAAMTARTIDAAELLATALGADVIVAGRAARGEFDADPHVHLRIVTDRRIGAIAATLVGAGWEEPEFATLETDIGRCDQLLTRREGLMLTVTRLPASHARRAAEPTDLVTGRPAAIATPAQLRAREGRGPVT